MKRVVSGCLAIAASLLVLVSGASAQSSWPERTVRFVVPHQAGGSASFMTNLLAEELTKNLGQQFIIDYQPGATGMIGSKAFTAESPDGYTLLYTGVPSHVIAPAVADQRPYDTMKDFTHIAYLGGANYSLVASSKLGVKSLAELVEYSKTQAEGINFVSSGTGTHGHIMTEYLGRVTGLKLNHIPYDGAGGAIQDLIAGHVQLGGMTWSSAAENVRAGEFVPLGIASAERLSVAPDVPTFKELGYPDLEAQTWFAIAGPAGMDPALVAKINAEIIKALAAPAIVEAFAKEAIEMKPMTPDELNAFFESELARWTPFAEEVKAAQ